MCWGTSSVAQSALEDVTLSVRCRTGMVSEQHSANIDCRHRNFVSASRTSSAQLCAGSRYPTGLMAVINTATKLTSGTGVLGAATVLLLHKSVHVAAQARDKPKKDVPEVSTTLRCVVPSG